MAAEPYLQDADATLYLGDCLDVLRELPDASVHMCATSPPFFGLRDYQVEGQIGLEASPDEWVARLVEVFREVRRVLRDDGTLWVEIGDSYSAQPGQRKTTDKAGDKQNTNAGSVGAASVTAPGCKPKDLIGQPWLLAQALRAPYYTGKIKDERDRVWLAAMLDAEGCIAIHKRNGTTSEYVRTQDSYQPKIEISNTSRAIMERIISITGEDRLRQQTPQQNDRRKQTIHRWTVTADKCRALLRELYPHLVGKQHEARLAYGCPSSGEKAAGAHEALKSLHSGNGAGIDFPAPESMFEAGWFLRSEIIWARLGPNPMPESVTDRPTKAHSTVFLLSKKPRYYYDAEAIREQLNEASVARYAYGFNNGSGAPPGEPKFEKRGTSVHLEAPTSGANARSVWTIPTEPTPFKHFATWPQKLCQRMILAGTSERGVCPECGAPWVRETSVAVGGIDGDWHQHRSHEPAVGVNTKPSGQKAWDNYTAPQTLGWRPSCGHDAEPVPAVVLDPFAGSGTTLLVARNLGRRSVGIELSEDYAKLCSDRLAQQSLLAI